MFVSDSDGAGADGWVNLHEQLLSDRIDDDYPVALRMITVIEVEERVEVLR